MSKLESDTLRELASLTGGIYRDASEWVDLPKLLQSTVEAGRKGRFTERNNVRYAERFQWALVPALLCLLVSFFREFPVRPKPRDIRLRGVGKAGERGKNTKPVPGSRPGLGLLAVGLALLRGDFIGFGRPGLSSMAASAAAPPGALLGRIVGRLSNHDANNALDWLELGRETLSWGEQLKSAGQPVPAGPVHDALDAVDLGTALDRKAGDWAKLRSDLQALLKNPEDKKQKPPLPKSQKNQNSIAAKTGRILVLALGRFSSAGPSRSRGRFPASGSPSSNPTRPPRTSRKNSGRLLLGRVRLRPDEFENPAAAAERRHAENWRRAEIGTRFGQCRSGPGPAAAKNGGSAGPRFSRRALSNVREKRTPAAGNEG